MKAAEIVNYVMEQRALRQKQAESSLNNRGKSVKNRPIRRKPKRKSPYTGPVLMTFSLPPKQILLDTDTPEDNHSSS